MSGHFNIQIWSSIKTERQEKLSFVPYSTALYENGKHVVQVSLQVEGDTQIPVARARLSHTQHHPTPSVGDRPTTPHGGEVEYWLISSQFGFRET